MRGLQVLFAFPPSLSPCTLNLKDKLTSRLREKLHEA